MKARLAATVVSFILTATTFSFAQINPDVRYVEVTDGISITDGTSVDYMSQYMDRLGAMLDGLLNPGGTKGFNPQPDPPKASELLPAIQTMIDFCNQMVGDPFVGDPFVGDPFVGDPRWVEIRKLLEEIQEMLRMAESDGMTDEIAARMAADYFRILRLLEEMKAKVAVGDLR